MISFPTIRLARVKDRRGLMPPGFRPRQLYQVLAGFQPNGSTDLHYYVVDASGRVVALRASDVILADPREAAYRAGVGTNPMRLCRVRARNGSMPPGFRERQLYQVIDLFQPNGSSDLHLYVVNESGDTVAMLAADVIVADPREPGYPTASGQSSGTPTGAGLTFSFGASRTWHVVYGLARLVSVMAVDSSRRVIVPHRVAFTVDLNEVTAYWSFPTAGQMTLT